jgi:zinc protease
VTATQVFEDEIQRADWGGVPVLWVEAPAPFSGGLLFRVGRADETLRNGGLTHLVEHVALSSIGRGTYGYNGRVEAAFTSFYASGTADEVVEHLRKVAGALENLPIDRFESEKRILAAEASSNPASLDARLMALRFGPVGYGLVNSAELGLGWVSPDGVATWAAERFNAANAAVWLTGRPPDDLGTLSLPRGQSFPAPTPEPIPSLDLPSHLADGTGGVALSFLGTRATALHSAFVIAVERAHASLRSGAAVSYAPGGSYFPLTGDVAHVVLNADCRDQDAAQVQRELLGILDDLAANGPTAEELEWDRTMLERALADPHWGAPALDSWARDALFGVESPTRSDLVREREELTPARVAEALAGAVESLLVLVPDGVAKPAGRPLSTFAPEYKQLIEGRRHPVTTQWEQWGERNDIVVGEEGISYVSKDGADVMSWRFDDCVAGIRQLSGAITVVGRDGSWLTVYPQRYLGGANAVAQIANALGEDRLVPISNRAREMRPLVEEQLGDRVGRVPQEVDLLEDVLGAEEELRALAEARRGDQVGLLSVTDRRLIFEFWGTQQKELLEKPLDSIATATVKGMVKKRLVISHDEGTVEFEDVKPPGRAPEIAELLARS